MIRECFRRRGLDGKGYLIKLRQRLQTWNRLDWFERCFSGHASYSFPAITITVPAPRGYAYRQDSDGRCYKVWQDPITFNSERFAQVLIHEIDHTLGLRHRDMIKSSEIDASWARNFVVRPKPPKPEPAIEQVVRKRYELVLERIKRNETRLKRIKTSLKKLHRRKRYYERKFERERSDVNKRGATRVKIVRKIVRKTTREKSWNSRARWDARWKIRGTKSRFSHHADIILRTVCIRTFAKVGATPGVD